jgi:ATP-dependent DNA ligase
MLCSSLAEVGKTFEDYIDDPNWVLEEKLDGHRMTVVVEGDKVTAWTRPGADKPSKIRKLPAAIVEAMKRAVDGWYDCELLVPGGQSTDVVRLDLQDKLVLAAFDVIKLFNHGAVVDGTKFAYTDRRTALGMAVAEALSGKVFIPKSVPVTREALADIWNNVAASSFVAPVLDRPGEGAVLKRLNSTYQPGCRGSDWVKVKRKGHEVLTVTGFEEGKSGPYSTIKLVTADGHETGVKTLNNAWLARIAKDPQGYIGRRLVVSYIEKTASGSLRHGMWDHFEGADA